MVAAAASRFNQQPAKFKVMFKNISVHPNLLVPNGLRRFGDMSAKMTQSSAQRTYEYTVQKETVWHMALQNLSIRFYGYNLIKFSPLEIECWINKICASAHAHIAALINHSISVFAWSYASSYLRAARWTAPTEDAVDVVEYCIGSLIRLNFCFQFFMSSKLCVPRNRFANAHYSRCSTAECARITHISDKKEDGSGPAILYWWRSDSHSVSTHWMVFQIKNGSILLKCIRDRGAVACLCAAIKIYYDKKCNRWRTVRTTCEFADTRRQPDKTRIMSNKSGTSASGKRNAYKKNILQFKAQH